MHVLQWCLAYEPSDRPSCAQLLGHKYFEGFAEWFEPQLKEALEKDAQDFVMFKRRKVLAARGAYRPRLPTPSLTAPATSPNARRTARTGAP